MQRKLNIGLTATLWGAYFPRLALGWYLRTYILGSSSILIDKSVLQYLVYLNKQYGLLLGLKTHFLSRNLELGYLTGSTLKPIKSLGTEFITNFVYLCSQLATVPWTSLGGDLWKLASTSPGLLLHETFPFGEFSWSFTFVNHSREYDYMLSPISLCTRSSNLVWTFDIPNKLGIY